MEYTNLTSMYCKLFTLLACLSITATMVQASENITLISEHFPPLNYEKGGQLQGPSVDIVQEMMHRLNLDNNIIIRPWARGYRTTTNTPNTCLFSTAKSHERENRFKWIGPLAEKRYAFYAKANNEIIIKTLQDAKPLIIGVQRKGTSEEYLVSKGFARVSNVTESRQNLQQLLSERIDLWYTSSSTMLDTLQELNIQTNQVEQVLVTHSVKFYIACNKNTPNHVISEWQKVYDDLNSEGTVKEIFERYQLENLYLARN